MLLGRYGPGEIVGEMALDGKPRSASVRATEPVTVSRLGFAGLRSLTAARPELSWGMIERLIGRARAATLEVRNLALLDVYGRIARLLLELEAAAAVRPGAARERLTQQEIANRVGASREMVGRILKDLLAGGYIAREGKRITVLRRPPARW
jgi:CRP/FNR family cyclic AMP-dependent transcriptional regulator